MWLGYSRNLPAISQPLGQKGPLPSCDFQLVSRQPLRLVPDFATIRLLCDDYQPYHQPCSVWLAFCSSGSIEKELYAVGPTWCAAPPAPFPVCLLHSADAGCRYPDPPSLTGVGCAPHVPGFARLGLSSMANRENAARTLPICCYLLLFRPRKRSGQIRRLLPPIWLSDAAAAIEIAGALPTFVGEICCFECI